MQSAIQPRLLRPCAAARLTAPRFSPAAAGRTSSSARRDDTDIAPAPPCLSSDTGRRDSRVQTLTARPHAGLLRRRVAPSWSITLCGSDPAVADTVDTATCRGAAPPRSSPSYTPSLDPRRHTTGGRRYSYRDTHSLRRSVHLPARGRAWSRPGTHHASAGLARPMLAFDHQSWPHQPDNGRDYNCPR